MDTVKITGIRISHEEKTIILTRKVLRGKENPTWIDDEISYMLESVPIYLHYWEQDLNMGDEDMSFIIDLFRAAAKELARVA